MTQTVQDSAKKRVMIKTFGCQMNAYDSQRMTEIFESLGYESTAEMGQADVILLNTCHIREKAAEKVYSELGRIKLIQDARRASGRDTIIGVAGCVAQAEGGEIFKRAKMVDMVFGPQTYHRLPQFLAEVKRRREADITGPGRGVLDVDFPEEYKFDNLPKAQAAGVSAFVSIQEGCDKFCHFCVVPYTRGAEYSRTVAEVLDETKTLLDQGVKEITLLGQNVNAYHGATKDGEWSLGRLCYALAELEGLERIRYTTSHPRDVDQDLINAHRDLPQLMPYLHLPIQSGSDRMLKAMNRRHTAAEYMVLIEAFRKARPDMAFSSDFIVGYPGETDEDHQASLQLIRDVHYAQAYSFKYSPRPGTPAANLECKLPEEVKDQRLYEIQALLKEQQIAFNESCVGKTMPVLFEKPGRHQGQVVGRSPYLQAVHFFGDLEQIGQIHDVKIQGATGNSLGGEVVG